jgi:hypothetical protein
VAQGKALSSSPITAKKKKSLFFFFYKIGEEEGRTGPMKEVAGGRDW